jgi:hypothetical protein
LRERVREELREHLLEAEESGVAEGLSQEDAVSKATEEFGEPATVRADLEAVYGRRPVGLLLRKAFGPRDRAMRTASEWGLVRDLALISILAVEVSALAFWVLFLLRITVEAAHILGEQAGHEVLLIRPCACYKANGTYGLITGPRAP